MINVIGLLEAVDVKQSVIEPRETGGRGQLYSFKIDPTLIIIDESLCEELIAFGSPGVLMLPTERYDGWD